MLDFFKIEPCVRRPRCRGEILFGYLHVIFDVKEVFSERRF